VKGDFRAIRENALRMIDEFRISAPSPETPVRKTL